MNSDTHPIGGFPADDLGEKLLRALRLDGTLAPETEDEVAIVEAEDSEVSVELPASLMNELELVKQIVAGFSSNVVQFPTQGAPEIEQELARAARLGKRISPGVEERMWSDKKQAQARANEKPKKQPE